MVVGAVVALAPAAFSWIPPATVYAITVILIAAIYIGFAVADGRPHVVAVEIVVVVGFVALALLAMVGTLWLAVVGLFAHGCKDLWQHRTGFVANTRWWPPFCVTVDWVAALLVAILLITRTSIS